MNKYNIYIHPRPCILEGNKTEDRYIELCADNFYNEWVEDFKFRPEDVKKLIDIAVQQKEQRRSEQKHKKYERKH